MNAFAEALSHTPWWVYLLFGFLLMRGFKASKTKTTSIKKILILPAIFLVMSLNTLIFHTSLDPLTVISYLLSLGVGMAVGWLLVRNLEIKFDKQQGLIRIPGTWTTLVFILLIFATRYYFGYSLAVDPKRGGDPYFQAAMSSVSGVCTGLFLGRLATYLAKGRGAPHCELDR